MTTKDRRIQIRVDAEMKAMLDKLAKHWSPIGDPLTPSEVFRECLRRVADQEIKSGKPKKKPR